MFNFREKEGQNIKKDSKTHSLGSSDWTTRRYRHNSLYLHTATTVWMMATFEFLNSTEECIFCLYLFCCCSTSVLSKTTDICSTKTSFLPFSFRKPDTFCPFSTDTSRTSSHGRTLSLQHKSKRYQGSLLLNGSFRRMERKHACIHTHTHLFFRFLSSAGK